MSIVHPANNVGTDKPLGGTPGSNFQPQYILYYKLNVATNGSASPDDWTYTYLKSGLCSSINIANFIDAVQNGSLPHLSPTSDNPVDPPSITLTDQCYVVIDLISNDSNLKFQAGVPAMKTATDHSADYCRLTHVDPSGDTHIGQAVNACNLIYFAVKNVRSSGEDPFNLYVQYTNGTTVLKVIDPALKNRGGA